MTATCRAIASVLLLLLCFPLLSQGAAIQVRDRVLSPTESMREAEMNQAKLDAIHEWAARSIEQGKFPGVQYLIARHGQIVAHEALGVCNAKTQAPMLSDTLCWFASNTKPITGAAIMLLSQEGKLDLDDPVAKYIPAFNNTRLADGRPTTTTLTIRHLLTHTGGVPDPPHEAEKKALARWWDKGLRTLHLRKQQKEPANLEQAINEVAQKPLNFPPGMGMAYSTAGINTLGRIIEICSQQTLDQFLKERFFQPLLMTNTSFFPDAKHAGWIHKKAKSKWVLDWTYDRKWTIPWGGGGLWSTSEDMAKFVQMFLNGGVYGGRKILDQKTIEAALTQQMPGTGRGAAWCVGPQLYIGDNTNKIKSRLHAPQPFFWHAGAAGTFAFGDLNHDLLAVLVVQTNFDPARSREFADLVLKACSN